MKRPIVLRRRTLVLLVAAVACFSTPASDSAGQAPAGVPDTTITPPIKADSPVLGKEKVAAGKTKPKYLRILRDKDENPLALEVAIVRLGSGKPGGPYVDLIGAVHVGEAGYYKKLNEMFRDYDAVLYELVAPTGTRIPKGGGGRPTSGVGMMQSGMTEMLELTYQLEKIDYTKKNFVHADISPDEFSSSMKKRGESFAQVFFKMLGRAIAQDANGGKSQETQFDMFAAFFSKDRALAMKRTMAKQFEDMEGAMDVFEGKDGSTIVTVRNERAVNVLEKQVKNGRKKLSIFYGAAHMPDMAERIKNQFGWKTIGETKWMMAWDLKDPNKKNTKPKNRLRKKDANNK